MSSIKEIMSILPTRVHDKPMYEEFCYIQHIPEDVELAQTQFIKYCVDVGVLPDRFLDNIHRQGIIGRYLESCGNSEVEKTWNRFMCIDNKFREWSSTYNSFNPINIITKEFRSLNSDPDIVQFFRNRSINKIFDNGSSSL